MAHDNEFERSHVSGFVRQMKENKEHGNVHFRVLKEKFILPIESTFGKDIIRCRQMRSHVLVMFEKGNGTHPKVTGVIIRPRLSEIRSAAAGWTYQEVLRLSPRDEFVEVKEGVLS